jgi:hypothetical protein
MTKIIKISEAPPIAPLIVFMRILNMIANALGAAIVYAGLGRVRRN